MCMVHAWQLLDDGRLQFWIWLVSAAAAELSNRRGLINNLAQALQGLAAF